MMKKIYLTVLLSLGILLINPHLAIGQDALSPEELLKLKSITAVQISPKGKEVIYSVSTPRGPNDKPGSSSRKYLRASISNWVPTPLFENIENASSPQYSSDGKHIGFLYAEKGGSRQVWVMNSTGGNIKKLTNEPSGVSQFKWQPGKKGIAYLSRAMTTNREEELKKRGYDFIFYEENLKNSTLHMASYDEAWSQISVWKLTHEGNTWDFEFDRQGKRIAASISPLNLIDQRYMFRKIFLIDLESGEMRQVSQNEGKLGNYVFSPDGQHLAYAAALNINDSQVSQAYVVNLASGTISNLTPPDFRGHVSWVNWKDNDHLLYQAGEGVYPTLSAVPVSGGPRVVILNAADNGVIFGHPLFTSDFKHFVFTGSTPNDRSNLYHWDGKSALKKVTNQNPWLKEKLLGKQEAIRFQARDGLEIEGILIHPPTYTAGKSYPLIVYVHGGPEAHESNGWMSRYATPGQVMAGKEYLVLYLNYRASTGYGVYFAMEGFMDPAGKEFDDIADGIDWAVREKGADPKRVGMAGGSYGGMPRRGLPLTIPNT
jgi:dipeptidyl aminopeptidase/acylaminoacyl peptidase